MKKLLIALVLVFFCTQGYAQFYVGGTFGFSYSNLKGAGGMGGFDDFYGVGDGNGYDDDDYSSPAETGFHLNYFLKSVIICPSARLLEPVSVISKDMLHSVHLIYKITRLC